MLEDAAVRLFDDPITVFVVAVLIVSIFLQIRETRRLRKRMNELTYEVSELKMLIMTS
ncbi:hypothetical protein ACFXS9_26925 [Bradyrhizobium sp. RDI18]